MLRRKILISCLMALLSLSESAIATDGTASQFPVLAEGMVVLNPKNEADQKKLRSILGDERYQAMMREAQKDKGYPVYVEAQKPVGQSNAVEVATLVREMRDNVCKALKKGDEFKFTMAWDASAKIWGIGVSGNSGIEVTIKCER